MLSLCYDTVPPRCHIVKDMTKKGNHRTSIKHRNFWSIIFSPVKFHLFSSGTVAMHSILCIVIVIYQREVYWDWGEQNQNATFNPKLDLKT